MNGYIDREELMKFPIRRNHYDKEHGNKHFIYGIETVLEYAKNLPAADVTQVRHGHWIYHPDDLFPNDSTQECSYCHAEESLTLYNENYCPNCGARMDEEASE